MSTLVSGLLLAATLAAPPSAALPDDNTAAVLAGIRTMCHEGGKLTMLSSEPGRTIKLLAPLRGRRMAKLANGDSIVMEPKGKVSQLLVEAEDGRYRRIMETDGGFLLAKQSPDAKYVAVGLSREGRISEVRPLVSSIYLIDTDKYEGRELLKQAGLTTFAWSSDGKYLALSDFAKLRILEVATGKQKELCLLDHPTVPDGKEWIDDIKWENDKSITFAYRLPSVNLTYRVTLP